MEHPGRVRILPINPSFAFPEWHPHDKDRLIRFKLKYRFWTTSPEGTRIVCTYVEIITDEYIEEYINDQLIDRRPNPLGFIPVVHIANKPVLASPWGLSDIIDIIPLNRTYNETATDILDIINYHVAPVTVITGAKASQPGEGREQDLGTCSRRMPGSRTCPVDSRDWARAGVPGPDQDVDARADRRARDVARPGAGRSATPLAWHSRSSTSPPC